MYSTCVFCRSSLGRNEVLEIFPFGIRVAFDPVKGRLWVICPRCNCWNLAPIEERFEVIEACEELFQGTRVRFSTDNVGLARIRNGFDIVRIGRALRPEFASWRYGPTLRRRRIEMSALVGASIVVAAGASIGGVWLNAFNIGAVALGAYGYSLAVVSAHHWRRLARVDAGDGTFVQVRGQDLRHSRLAERDGRLALELRHSSGQLLLRDSLAISAIRLLAPLTNPSGGSSSEVAKAVELLGAVDGDAGVAGVGEPRRFGVGVALTNLSPERRLALEMAANEQLETRAFAGELAELERIWRDAEEVAAIADNLLVPPFVERWIRRHKNLGDRDPAA